MNHIYVFFFWKENWNLPTLLREYIYIYIYIYICMYVCMYVEGGDRATQGGHGPSRFLFLKLRVYMFYDIFRIGAKENYF